MSWQQGSLEISYLLPKGSVNISRELNKQAIFDASCPLKSEGDGGERTE